MNIHSEDFEDYWYRLPNVSYAARQHSLEVRLSPTRSMLVRLGSKQDAEVRAFLEKYEPFAWGGE